MTLTPFPKGSWGPSQAQRSSCCLVVGGIRVVLPVSIILQSIEKLFLKKGLSLTLTLIFVLVLAQDQTFTRLSYLHLYVFNPII